MGRVYTGSKIPGQAEDGGITSRAWTTESAQGHDVHMRVRLYRNLSPQYRKQRAWSLMAMEGPKKGRVLDIVDGALLKNATFKVSEAGRQRVIRDKAKNVHAFVDGSLVKKWKLNSLPTNTSGSELCKCSASSRVNYDPYTTPKMVREDCRTQEFVDRAPVVVASPKGIFAKLGRCRA